MKLNDINCARNCDWMLKTFQIILTNDYIPSFIFIVFVYYRFVYDLLMFDSILLIFLGKQLQFLHRWNVHQIKKKRKCFFFSDFWPKFHMKIHLHLNFARQSNSSRYIYDTFASIANDSFTLLHSFSLVFSFRAFLYTNRSIQAKRLLLGIGIIS